jgi:K+-sensing histidine kinase KdpD
MRTQELRRDSSRIRTYGRAAVRRAGIARGPLLLRGCVAGAAVLAISTLLSVAGAPLLPTAAFAMLFPVGVLIVTARFGVVPAVLTAVGGVLVFDFVIVPPPMCFVWLGLKDGLTLAAMLALAAVAGVLAEHLRRQLGNARRQTELERLRNAILSSLSHDLRTPLTSLVGASAALCENGLEPLERNQFSRMVASEALRLNRLVNSLLELTRLEPGHTHTRAAQAIDEVIGSALSRLEAQLIGRRVRTDVPAEVPLAAFDPVLIEQVVVNLVENVVQHAGAASPVEIAAHFSEDAIAIEVADRGPGVSTGDEERVFEKLYRAKSHDDAGTGLGLTICRAIVKAHGGKIWLENRSGGGAVVTFTLPVDAAAPDIESPSWGFGQ